MFACSLELSLDTVNSMLVDLKSLRKDVIGDGWLGPKYSVGHSDHPRVLATQCCKGHGALCSIIELEMDQSLREHEHIPFVKNLCEQLVVRV